MNHQVASRVQTSWTINLISDKLEGTSLAHHYSSYSSWLTEAGSLGGEASDTESFWQWDFDLLCRTMEMQEAPSGSAWGCLSWGKHVSKTFHKVSITVRGKNDYRWLSHDWSWLLSADPSIGFGSMGGGAWPFLVGGVICLVNSVNEGDLNLLNSYM